MFFNLRPRSGGSRHTALVRDVLTACVVFSVTLAGCAPTEPAQATTVVFDGETVIIDGHASCVRQLDGKLAINAPGSRQTGGTSRLNTIRVVLTDTPRLVVESVGIRTGPNRGFSDVSDEMWATKADNAYTINGRLLSDDGSPASHQFKIDVTCPFIDKQSVDLNPPIGAP